MPISSNNLRTAHSALPHHYTPNEQPQLAGRLLFKQADLISLLYYDDILEPYIQQYKQMDINFTHTPQTSIIHWNLCKRNHDIFIKDLLVMYDIYIEKHQNDTTLLQESNALIGDILTIRKDLIQSFLPLIRFLAQKYAPSKDGVYSKTDLEQEGYLGLIHAIELLYYIHPDFSPATYMGTHIKQSINRFVRETQKGIKVPYHHSIKKSQEDYINQNSEKYISYVLHLSELDDQDIDAIPYHGDADRRHKKNLHDLIKSMLDQLTEQERTIIILRYGLDGNKQHTLADIANKVGLTRARISQIESLSLKKLQNLVSNPITSSTDTLNDFLK